MKSDFLWGSASAAYQIEGAAALEGKGPSIWDNFSAIAGNTYANTTGALTIDFYHRFAEDIELMKEMGLKSYRFSISWPRILPTGTGKINQKGIDFYHQVIDLLLENEIEPVVTIYHWDLPQALEDKYGGFANREIIDDFAEYCQILFNEYGNKVNYWITLNEQNVFMESGYLDATFPPQKNDYQLYFNANHYASLANAKAIKLYRDLGYKGKIGPSFAYKGVYAKTNNPQDVLAMEDAQELTNWLWLDVYIKGKYNPITLQLISDLGIELDYNDADKEVLNNGKCDFIGINYYRTQTIKAPDGEKEQVEYTKRTVNSTVSAFATDKLYLKSNNEFLPTTEWNWSIDPVGLRILLRRITSRYDVPIMITENGLGAIDQLNADGTINDPYRIAYLEAHIKEVELAMSQGSDVIGYFTWSFQDLFSWLNGYQKRYGFVYVDRDVDDESELKRYKKDSFYWYQQVIATNGVLKLAKKNKTTN